MVRANVSGAITTGPGASAEINVSSTGIGVENQSISPLQGVFIDFVDGATRTLDGQAPIADLDFDNHVSYNNAGFGVSQLKPNTNTVIDVRVSIYDEAAADPADSAAEIINDETEDIAEITIRAPGGAEHTFSADGSFNIGGRLISVDFDPANQPANGDYVEIDNLGAGYQVLIQATDGGFERMLVENVGTGNEGFDISNIIIEQFSAGDPISMTFDVALKDGDLDTALGTVGVTLTAPDAIF